MEKIKNYFMLIIALGVFCMTFHLQTVKAEENNLKLFQLEDQEMKNAYGNILWQYRQVWQTENVDLSMRGKESIVNYLVYYGPWSEEQELLYSLTDLDGNGTVELLIAISRDIIDIFTYSSGKIVHLLEGTERSYLSFCEEGILSVNGSGGAAHNYQRYYVIGEDGCSCEMIGYYYINSEDNYVEELDGTIHPFDGNFEQYQNMYEEQPLVWAAMDEYNIAAYTVGQEEAGAPLTVLDIVTAPCYKNGMLENSYGLFEDYLRITVGLDIYSSYWITQDYEEQQAEQDVFYVEERESDTPVGTYVLNLQTGEIRIEKADGSVDKGNILYQADVQPGMAEPATEIPDTEKSSETAQVSVRFEHYYDGNNEGAVILGSDQNGNILWTYQSGQYSGTQLQRIKEMGINGNRYYFSEDGTVVALNIADGEVLWTNSEFLGSPSCFDFDENGDLYVCGYLEPDLFVVSKEGHTLARVSAFDSSAYFRPIALNLNGDHTLSITYESGTGEYEEGYTLSVSLEELGI